MSVHGLVQQVVGQKCKTVEHLGGGKYKAHTVDGGEHVVDLTPDAPEVAPEAPEPAPEAEEAAE